MAAAGELVLDEWIHMGPFHFRVVRAAATGERYLLGADITHLLHRESYNLYRSMRLRGMVVWHCTPHQTAALKELGVVKQGIHAATLVPLETARRYVLHELERHHPEAMACAILASMRHASTTTTVA
jgi:hypothetical protein